MRAAVSSPIRFFAWTVAALSMGAMGALTTSCADSIHLDPPGSGGAGGTAASSSSSGGGKAGECVSNSGCAYPQPVCDTVIEKCKECLTAADCAITKPGTVCSSGSCVCAPDETTAPLTYCAATSTRPYRCVDTQTASSDCGGCDKGCFGSCNEGKCADRWRPVATAGAPAARSQHVAVWTGSKMFVWGGLGKSNAALSTGGLYDPAADAWTATSTVNAPSPRYGATAVWDDTDQVVIVWGGHDAGGTTLNTGGVYDPVKNTWATMPTANGPSPRAEHTAVWASAFTSGFMGAPRGMIVWGGFDGTNRLVDGFVYEPATSKWLGPIDDPNTNMNSPGPSARSQHTAVWDDSTHRMAVWGGNDGQVLADGALWDPSVSGTPNAWTSIGGGGPTARALHTAVWLPGTQRMIIWGGWDGTYLADGWLYDASALAWAQLSAIAPEERANHTAVLIASTKQMLIFGGDQGPNKPLNTLWALDTTQPTPTWSLLSTAPAARTHHTAVVAGDLMIMWGGDGGGGNNPLGDGAIYDASP